MKSNIGSLDRAIRVVVGLALFGAGYHFGSWLGLIGLVPLLTGTARICPLYSAVGWSTRPREKPESLGA